MAEELIQRRLTKEGIRLDIYEYFPLGNTTFRTLKRYEIIPNWNYGDYENRKPDALLVDRRDKTNINVIMVIEFKDYSTFNTQKKKEEAIEECVGYCKALKAEIGIATDTQEYIWVNPQIDEGWEPILNEDSYPLQIPLKVEEQGVLQNITILDKVLGSISPTNSNLKKEETQNPTNLADRVWQKIWLASGENPDICLATFVEVFLFKYLSDLNVLTINEVGAKVDFDEAFDKDGNSLKYYFQYTRPYIRKLFPPSDEDNTSIINGIVLDPDIEAHNFLFHEILDEFRKFGQLKNIDPQFKSRLYEKFLKKSLGQKNWGQFFTPRNIVKAIIQMSEIEKLPDGAKVYDPACGVGGFLFEPLLSKRQGDFYIDNKGNLQQRLNYLGHDRDRDTIILAKANMLIFLSDTIKQHRAITQQFADIFNSVCKSMHTSILGSLTCIKPGYYDLIMTNPPYVTKGTSIQKKAIQEDGRLRQFYRIKGVGVESLFVEKVIRELKPKGTAFIILPDGIFERDADKRLRTFIRNSCIINAIVSLPIDSFFSSSKKTYILSITKKTDVAPQTSPFFAYLISNTGETLDVYRFETENDLPEMASAYRQFMADKENYEPKNLRCKILPISKLDQEDTWIIDRWWIDQEKVELGISKEEKVATLKELIQSITSLEQRLEDIKEQLTSMPEKDLEGVKFVSKRIDALFEIEKGKAEYTREHIRNNPGDYPLYSSKTEDRGVLGSIDSYDYDCDCLTWTTDGVYAGEVFYRRGKFSMTTHCGGLFPLDEHIYLPYVKYVLKPILKSKTRGTQNKRVTVSMIKKIITEIPVKTIDGKQIYDVDKQKEIAERYETLNQIKNRMENQLRHIVDVSANVLL